MIAAFGGGVDAIQKLLAMVPRACGGSIFIALHIGDRQTGWLPAVLGQRTSLPISHPADGTRIRPGHVYVAPGNHHMLLHNGHIRLNNGAKVNWTRPAADPLFISAAEAYGPLVVGIVLTGYLHDGAVGLACIKAHGCLTLVQDPRKASA